MGFFGEGLEGGDEGLGHDLRIVLAVLLGDAGGPEGARATRSGAEEMQKNGMPGNRARAAARAATEVRPGTLLSLTTTSNS